MFNKPIILSKVKELAKHKTIYSGGRSIEVEYLGYKYIIRIEPVVQKKFDVERYVWLIYFEYYDEVLKNDRKVLVAYSRKTYCYDPQLMEKDAFKCVQKISEELE